MSKNKEIKDSLYYTDLIYVIKLIAGFEQDKDEETEKRFLKRLENIPEEWDGITFYGKTEFSKEINNIVVRIMKKNNKDTYTDIVAISKYPESVKEVIAELEEKAKNAQLTVLAVPCSRAFVVAPEKWEQFKNQKPNPEIRRQMEEMVNKFKVNNLVEEPKKRIRKKR